MGGIIIIIINVNSNGHNRKIGMEFHRDICSRYSEGLIRQIISYYSLLMSYQKLGDPKMVEKCWNNSLFSRITFLELNKNNLIFKGI